MTMTEVIHAINHSIKGDMWFTCVFFCADTVSTCSCDSFANDTSPQPEVNVWFEPSSYTVNEDDGNVTLFIRTNATTAIAEGAVHFRTENSELTFIATDDGDILSPAIGMST